MPQLQRILAAGPDIHYSTFVWKVVVKEAPLVLETGKYMHGIMCRVMSPDAGCPSGFLRARSPSDWVKHDKSTVSHLGRSVLTVSHLGRSVRGFFRKFQAVDKVLETDWSKVPTADITSMQLFCVSNSADELLREYLH